MPCEAASRRARGCSRCRRRSAKPVPMPTTAGRGTERRSGAGGAQTALPSRDEGEADERARRAPKRSARAAAGNLHDQVGGEQRGHEEPDRSERDAVGVRERVASGADARDVPADGEADADPPDAVHAREATRVPPRPDRSCRRARTTAPIAPRSSSGPRASSRLRSSAIRRDRHRPTAATMCAAAGAALALSTRRLELACRRLGKPAVVRRLLTRACA